MIIDNRTLEVVTECLRHNIPFALYSLPMEEAFHFGAGLPLQEKIRSSFLSRDCFFINFFDNQEKYTASIPFDMNVVEALNFIQYCEDEYYQSPAIHPSVKPTTRKDYSTAFFKVKTVIAESGGKIVISRNRVFFTQNNFKNILENYFSKCPDTFRFLVSTTETGVWIGASPELLLKYDYAEEFSTMALAGTRSSTCGESWDEKNILEHEMVVDYLNDKLSSYGLNVEIGERGEKRFTNLSHLMTPISAKGYTDPVRLLKELSPTSAVCGYPVEIAKQAILSAENHSRHCYGGFIGFRKNDMLYSFVNLRSIFIEPAVVNDEKGLLVNMLTGGGILSQSEEENEWLETEAKGSILATILTGKDGRSGYELLSPLVNDFSFIPWSDYCSSTVG